MCFCVSRFVPLNFQLEFGCVFSKSAVSFTFSSKFFFLFSLYRNIASLDSQGEIVPKELPNPEKTQIWEGENESVRSCQRLLLQLLLVFYIAAFICQKQWMLR